MMYDVGDSVVFQGKVYTIYRFSGVMQITNGTMNKYDLLDWAGNIIINDVYEIELELLS